MSWCNTIAVLLLTLPFCLRIQAAYYYEYSETDCPYEIADRYAFRQSCQRAGDAGWLMLCGSMFAQTLVEVNHRHRRLWRPRYRYYYRYHRRPYVLVGAVGALMVALANLLEVCLE